MPDADRPRALDASVAIPLVLRNHPSHGAVRSWCRGRRLAVCGHAWIETYAVLTRLPGSARATPADAARVLASAFAAPLWVAPETVERAVEMFASAGVAGGATYDAWIALAARDHGSVLATRDRRAEPTYRRLGVDVELLEP